MTQAQLEDCFATKPKKSRAAIVGKELCGAFLAASIPWMKLDVPKFCGFFESNIGISMPDRTTLEKKYLCNKWFKTVCFLSEFQNHIFCHILAFSAHIVQKKKKDIKTSYFAEQNDIKIPCLINHVLVGGNLWWGVLFKSGCI